MDRARIAVQWLGPGFALLGIALLIMLWVSPATNPNMIVYGVKHAIASYERVLPLIAIGLAIAQMKWRYACLSLALLLASAAVGWSVKDQLIFDLITGSDSVRYLSYIRFTGPLSCILAALLLGVPGRFRQFVLPLVATVIGGMFGFGLALEDPTLGDWHYIAGVTAALSWVILLPPLALRQLRGAWLRIGGRIFASWLLAIGMLLGASKLLPAPQVAEPLSAAPPSSAAVPGLEPDSTAVGHASVPKKPSWIDETQPP
jgi:hypothetical protein